MGAVTQTLGFGITACTTFEPPFLLAKRISTLDHLTNGRIAWVTKPTFFPGRVHCYKPKTECSPQNVVTSWSESAARAVGLKALPEHDERYIIADEYMELMYK